MTGLTKFFEYLKPSIDLLIALLGAFILLSKYLTQRRREYEERITESKRHAYSEFLRDFTRMAVNITHDVNPDPVTDDKERLLARNQLLLYANDKVIRAYHEWIEFADSSAQGGTDREVQLFGNILIEIRKDIHGKSKLTDQEIRNLNPFNRG